MRLHLCWLCHRSHASIAIPTRKIAASIVAMIKPAISVSVMIAASFLEASRFSPSS